MNITSEESCFDFVGKRNYYCDMGRGCRSKYQKLDGIMTCSGNWGDSYWVECGNACAWTQEGFWDSDAGARLGPGLAAIIYAMIFF